MGDEKPLTQQERGLLYALEEKVRRNLSTFREVGAALLKIRDKALYRGEFKSFKDYCREKWGFGRAHAYRLIDAAIIAERLPGETPVPDERTARRLKNLTPEERADVAKSANGDPDKLRDLAKKAAGSLPPEQQIDTVKGAEAQAETNAPAHVRDNTGRKERIAQCLRHLDNAKRVLKGIGGEYDDISPLFKPLVAAVRALPLDI
jgi:hypothetical protein